MYDSPAFVGKSYNHVCFNAGVLMAAFDDITGDDVSATIKKGFSLRPVAGGKGARFINVT